ncbi:MAG TPA: FAD-linked oxidase C-terminal domain-containing protein [Acidimicrobiales bacterium]|nr:FAD-linked oxidase C-terminal domain-containing protein [Acidimicrobiales bacterium]
MTHPILAELTDALAPGVLVLDPDVVEGYRHDRAMTAPAGTPLALVRATCTADVSTTVAAAARHRVGIVPRGAGTGLSGGSSAVDGCITLSTERMRALDVDPAAMLATVGPGLLNAEVKAAAREHGLWYPPDPSSFEICSIGGNLATNAGGLCCVRYGVTTDYVLGIEVVLADGRAVRLGGRTVKDVAGYDLKRLIVGSEGTLGIITEATLRLRPLPPPVSTVIATFADVVAAGRAVATIMAALRPSALELMDRAAVAAVERVRPMGLDPGIGALLLGQTDVGSGDAGRIAAACEAAGATYTAVTDDLDEGELLMGARRMAIPCVERLGTVLIEDVGVPVPRIPDLVAAVEAIAQRHRTSIPVIGHAGDGNLHPLVTFDASDPEASARAEAAFHEVMRAALELGGTVTGEHGIGSLKASHLMDQLGPDVMELTRRIKAALDPLGTLNPGKWV